MAERRRERQEDGDRVKKRTRMHEEGTRRRDCGERKKGKHANETVVFRRKRNYKEAKARATRTLNGCRNRSPLSIHPRPRPVFPPLSFHLRVLSPLSQLLFPGLRRVHDFIRPLARHSRLRVSQLDTYANHGKTSLVWHPDSRFENK